MYLLAFKLLSFSKITHVGTMNQSQDTHLNSMQICVPFYHHICHQVSSLCLLSSLFCFACPNDKWIRFHFLSQHYTFTLFYHHFVHVFWCDLINEFLVTLDVNRYHVVKMYLTCFLIFLIQATWSELGNFHCLPEDLIQNKSTWGRC